MAEMEVGRLPQETAHEQDTGPRQQADTSIGNESGGVGEGVYARAYPHYDERGWPNSLKLRPSKKAPPPEGFTGKGGKQPSTEQKAQWAQQELNGNIAQRMPECVICEQEWFVIGIDTDHYGAKRGGVQQRD